MDLMDRNTRGVVLTKSSGEQYSSFLGGRFCHRRSAKSHSGRFFRYHSGRWSEMSFRVSKKLPSPVPFRSFSLAKASGEPRNPSLADARCDTPRSSTREQVWLEGAVGTLYHPGQSVPQPREPCAGHC